MTHTLVASATREHIIGFDKPFTVIGERIVAHDPSFCSTTDPSDRNFRNLCTSVSWHLNRSPSHFHREARGLFRRL